MNDSDRPQVTILRPLIWAVERFVGAMNRIRPKRTYTNEHPECSFAHCPVPDQCAKQGVCRYPRREK